jgi:hypothetical protein
MGFWMGTLKIVQDVTSFGGTVRLRQNKEKLAELQAIYDRVRLQISDCNAELATTVRRLQRLISSSESRIRKAEKILNPLRAKGNFAVASGLAFGRNPTPLATGKIASVSSETNDNLTTLAPTVVGAGAGTATAVGSWGAVQILAHASTGTAMAGLHGAAASSAGWAWFGGGSLAAGGGGMALGHLVLPGIGTAVAIAVSSTMSHREANKLAKYCEELETVNRKNNSVLSLAKADLLRLNLLEPKLLAEDQFLSHALRQARRRLFRFGYFSHLWRLLTYRFRGYYYKKDEFIYIDQLGSAMLKFMNAFRK